MHPMVSRKLLKTVCCDQTHMLWIQYDLDTVKSYPKSHCFLTSLLFDNFTFWQKFHNLVKYAPFPLQQLQQNLVHSNGGPPSAYHVTKTLMNNHTSYFNQYNQTNAGGLEQTAFHVSINHKYRNIRDHPYIT